MALSASFRDVFVVLERRWEPICSALRTANRGTATTLHFPHPPSVLSDLGSILSPLPKRTQRGLLPQQTVPCRLVVTAAARPTRAILTHLPHALHPVQAKPVSRLQLSSISAHYYSRNARRSQVVMMELVLVVM